MSEAKNPLVEQRMTAAAANRKWKRHISALCREYTKDAVMTLVEIMSNPNEHTPSRVKAATEILNRGWGTSPVNIKLDNGGAVNLSAMGDEALKEIIAENMALLEAGGADDDYSGEFDDDEDGADDVPMPSARKMN